MQGAIVRLRSNFNDSDTRFFLAVLLSFAHKKDVLRTMAMEYAPEEIACTQLAAGIANVLGGDDRRFVSRELLIALLDNVSRQSLIQWLSTRWQRSLTNDEESAVRKYHRQITEHPWLNPLLR